MSLVNSFAIPKEHLRRLEFLLGEFTGIETLFPPDGPAVVFAAHTVGEWESCERFIRFDFFGDIPGIGIETFRAMVTFSPRAQDYQMWAFASSQEEPLHLAGDFDGETLVLVSEPTSMIWGLQKLRFSLTPRSHGGFELLGERWDLQGYVKYCQVSLNANSAPIA